MPSLPEDKISDLEKLLEKRRDLKNAAFVPGTDAETPPDIIYRIVAERYGEDLARAMKNLAAPGGGTL